MLERLCANYQKDGSGTLHKISEESLNDLQRISDETGATERFEKIENYSEQKAHKLNIDFQEGKHDYFDYLYNATLMCKDMRCCSIFVTSQLS